jgi:hypothetical protein
MERGENTGTTHCWYLLHTRMAHMGEILCKVDLASFQGKMFSNKCNKYAYHTYSYLLTVQCGVR